MSKLDWVVTESSGCDFGDARLNKRHEQLVERFGTTPSQSMPGTFKSWSETLAAYRFMNNANVTTEKILSPHKAATLNRIQQESLVLIAQDTTDIDYTGRKGLSDMGHLSSDYSQGFYLHASIAVTGQRVCLGVVDSQTWTRETIGKKKAWKQLPTRGERKLSLVKRV